MAYTVEQNMVLGALSNADRITEAKKWWSIMNGGQSSDTLAGHTSPDTLAHPKSVAAAGGRDAHFEFYFAPNPVEVDGAFSVKDVDPLRPGYGMDDFLACAAGTLVNCWDPDPTKRGRYVKVGASGTGSWNLVSANPADKAWTDFNHPQRRLELLICSWVKTLTPLSFMGPQQGWQGPSSGNWKNARVTLDMEVEEAFMGPFTKFGLHCQGSVPALSSALTALYPAAPNPKYLLPNQLQTRELIGDQLGFGTNSWGGPNSVPVVRSSGRKSVVVNLTTNDSDWQPFGDLGRDPTGRLVNYGTAPVAEVLNNLLGNIYLLTHLETPSATGANWFLPAASTISETDRFRGTIRVYGWKIESFS